MSRKSTYQQYLKSAHWKALRAEKKRLSRESHGGRLFCCVCTSDDRLHVHHLRYRKLYNVEPSDLRILCEKCHRAVHKILKSKAWRARRRQKKDRRWARLSAEILNVRGVESKPAPPAVRKRPNRKRKRIVERLQPRVEDPVPGYMEADAEWAGL